MINFFKSKKSEPLPPANSPSKIIFTQFVPLFGENFTMGLNEEKTEYECFCRIPFTDHSGNVYEKTMKYSLPAEMLLYKEFGLMTEDEFKVHDFKKTKISQLKELIAKIEKL